MTLGTVPVTSTAGAMPSGAVPLTATKVAVVIACQGWSAWLDACLAALEVQTFREFETIVVSDEALVIERAGVRTLRAGRVLPNRKRAIGAAASGAGIVAFLDDDAYPDPGWLAAAVRHFEDAGVVAVGGPAVTPPDDGARERASGAVYASLLVTAGTRCRYVAETLRFVDALPSCNLLVRRDVFLRDAEATARYWPGEDILTCFFATRDGGRIVYDPAALVFHHRRALFAGHLRQVWVYGRFRGFFLRRFARSPRDAVYAVPSAFVLAHAMLPALLARPRERVWVARAFAFYAGLVAWSALREGRAARANPLLVALGIYLTHLTYGAGFIAGALREEIAYDP
jgi:GT2 family glycosyltransferase